jgi:hypothetical protein
MGFAMAQTFKPSFPTYSSLLHRAPWIHGPTCVVGAQVVAHKRNTLLTCVHGRSTVLVFFYSKKKHCIRLVQDGRRDLFPGQENLDSTSSQCRVVSKKTVAK